VCKVILVNLLRQTQTFQANAKTNSNKDLIHLYPNNFINYRNVTYIYRQFVMNYQPLFEFNDKQTLSSGDSYVDKLNTVMYML